MEGHPTLYRQDGNEVEAVVIHHSGEAGTAEPSRTPRVRQIIARKLLKKSHKRCIILHTVGVQVTAADPKKSQKKSIILHTFGVQASPFRLLRGGTSRAATGRPLRPLGRRLVTGRCWGRGPKDDVNCIVRIRI